MKLALLIFIAWSVSITILYFIQSKNVKFEREMSNVRVEAIRKNLLINWKISEENNESLKKQIRILEQQNANLVQELFKKSTSMYGYGFNKMNNQNISQEIKDAVLYAMKKAHPDNGGREEDFIKFKACYDKLTEGSG